MKINGIFPEKYFSVIFKDFYIWWHSSIFFINIPRKKWIEDNSQIVIDVNNV